MRELLLFTNILVHAPEEAPINTNLLEMPTDEEMRMIQEKSDNIFMLSKSKMAGLYLYFLLHELQSEHRLTIVTAKPSIKLIDGRTFIALANRAEDEIEKENKQEEGDDLPN